MWVTTTGCCWEVSPGNAFEAGTRGVSSPCTGVSLRPDGPTLATSSSGESLVEDDEVPGVLGFGIFLGGLAMAVDPIIIR